MSAPRTYYGRPVLKPHVWSREIPAYLFAGGLAGTSAGLAYLTGARGDEVAARRAWLVATAGIAVSPPLLIADLGRPERFLNMLRMFKVTSPMSVGTWVLSVGSTSIGLSAVHSLTGRFRRAAAVARPVAALSGLGLSSYTAALLTSTAVPAWHEARDTLPFVFVAGAALSSGGACTAATPVRSAAAARRLALGGAAVELAAMSIMEARLGIHADAYRGGAAGRYRRIAYACVAAGASLMAWRGASSRPVAVAAGALMCVGALSTRLSVVNAGTRSALDPRYVIEPQRARVP